MNQCTATTTKKKQCKNKAMANQMVCHVHVEKKTTKKKTSPPPAPAAPVVFPTPHPSLKRPVLRRLNAKLATLPERRSGGAGFIYVYAIKEEHDAGRFYWKIGMTERAADVRIKEWGRTLDKRTQTLVVHRVYPVARGHKWVERVVHLYLNYCRVYRYALPAASAGSASGPHSFYSVWATTGLPVEEEDASLGPHDAPAMHKQVEWFYCPRFADLDAVIAPLVAASL